MTLRSFDSAFGLELLSHRMGDLFQLLLFLDRRQPYPIQRYSLLADSDHPFLEAITSDRLVISTELLLFKNARAWSELGPLSGCNGWTYQASMTIRHDDSSDDFMERADVIGLIISYDMLLDALSEAGGATSIKDRYPINDVIRQRPRNNSAVSRLSALSLN
jgi:hypothetical protein